MLIECSCAVCHGPLYYAATGPEGSGKYGVSPVTCSDNCRRVWHSCILKGRQPSGRRYKNLRVMNRYRQQLHADVATLARWMERHGIDPREAESEKLEADRLAFTWTRKYKRTLDPVMVFKVRRVEACRSGRPIKGLALAMA